ncbi:regulator of sigma E protease [Desulfovibrionales bacterium]
MNGVAIAVLVMSVLIVFHELGHFLVAKFLGIGVRVFSFGFGPKLLSFSWGQTQYKLSAVPLGGYVQLVGEHAGEEMSAGFIAAQSLTQRPAWQYMAVVVAGPFFNLLLAWLLYWAIFWVQGYCETLPLVGEVRACGPAAVAGVQVGDRVMAVGETHISSWRQLAETITASNGRQLTLTIERHGQHVAIYVTPEYEAKKNLFGEYVNTPLIGIKSSGETVVIPLDISSAAIFAWDQTWSTVTLTVQNLGKLIARAIPFDTVGGPIMIAQMVSDQAKQGLGNLMALTAIISVNLAIINLFPIPVLDGGHILFCGIEIVFRRPVNRRVQEMATKVGFMLLIILALISFYNDLQRLFNFSIFF